MNYQELLKKTEEQVTDFYAAHANSAFLYHNLEQVKETVDKAGIICAYYNTDERMKTTILAAIWFHDSGFLLQRENYEQKSAELAKEFLKRIGAEGNDIAEIQACILAATSQTPQTVASQIVSDALTYSFGINEFKEKNKLLRKETELLTGNNISGSQWRESVINILQKHQYHTSYCRSLLQDTKTANLADLSVKQEKKMQKQVKPIPEDTLLNSKEIFAKAKKQPAKGVDSMFRIAAANNVRISSMADNKAHIMITVNSIIISLVLGFIVRNVQDAPHYILPAVILLTMSVGTVIFAVMATRPKLAKGIFTQKQVEEKSVNLMFFGSYYQMEYDDYKDGMHQMMHDPDFLYNSLTKDVFWQGKVLGRKYRLLRISYGIFMYGLIVAVLSFIFVYLYY